MFHFSHNGSCSLVKNLTMYHHGKGLSNLGSIHFQVNCHLMQTPQGICSHWHNHFSWLGMIYDTTSMHLEETCLCFCPGTFIIVYSLCMQSPSVQFWDCRTSPSQSFPPFLGAGLLHSLLLHCVHSVPQADHLLQSVHTPSTSRKETRRMRSVWDNKGGKNNRDDTKSNVLSYAPNLPERCIYRAEKYKKRNRSGMKQKLSVWQNRYKLGATIKIAQRGKGYGSVLKILHEDTVKWIQ